MDLRVAAFGPRPVGVRRLHSLLSMLPPDSALARTMTQGWSIEHELAATQAEIAHAHLVVALAVGGVRKSRLPKPLHIDRPWETAAKKPTGPRPKAELPDVMRELDRAHAWTPTSSSVRAVPSGQDR